MGKLIILAGRAYLLREALPDLEALLWFRPCPWLRSTSNQTAQGQGSFRFARGLGLEGSRQIVEPCPWC